MLFCKMRIEYVRVDDLTIICSGFKYATISFRCCCIVTKVTSQTIAIKFNDVESEVIVFRNAMAIKLVKIRASSLFR